MELTGRLRKIESALVEFRKSFTAKTVALEKCFLISSIEGTICKTRLSDLYDPHVPDPNGECLRSLVSDLREFMDTRLSLDHTRPEFHRVCTFYELCRQLAAKCEDLITVEKQLPFLSRQEMVEPVVDLFNHLYSSIQPLLFLCEQLKSNE